MREQRGGIVHGSAVPRRRAGAIAVEVEEMPSGVAHRIEGDHVPAHQEVLVIAEVAHRVRDGVQIVAHVADLVDQAVVDRVVIAPHMKAGSRAEPHAAIQEGIVVAAHEDARFTGLDGIASLLDLPDAVVPGVVGDVGQIAAVHHAMRRVLQAQRGGADRQALDTDVLAPAQVECELAAFGLDLSRLRTVGGDQVQRVVLPMPFAGRVQRVQVAHDHAPPFLVLLREFAVVGRTEPPALRAVADEDLAGLGTFDHPGLRTPALEMDAAVQRALPVIVGLALQQPAHDPARLADARLLGDRELAIGRPQRRQVRDVHLQARCGRIRVPSFDQDLPAAEDLIASQAQRPRHRCLPDPLGWVMERPARHRLASADNDLLVPKRLERDGLVRRAAAGERHGLAIGAAANQQGIARLEFVYRGLNRRQRLRLRARMGVVTGGADVEVGGLRPAAMTTTAVMMVANLVFISVRFMVCEHSTTVELSFSRTSLDRDMPIGHSGATYRPPKQILRGTGIGKDRLPFDIASSRWIKATRYRHSPRKGIGRWSPRWPRVGGLRSSRTGATIPSDSGPRCYRFGRTHNDGHESRGISLGFGGLFVVASAVVAEQAAAGEPKLPADVPPAIRLFNCDFNWARWPPSESLPHGNVRPSLPEDWAEVDARAYFNWHREFGNNVVYCQASAWASKHRSRKE